MRCTHGSTSGRVDEELIFYAQCRGFTRKEAIRAIVTGFFQQIFDRITIESVRDALGTPSHDACVNTNKPLDWARNLSPRILNAGGLLEARLTGELDVGLRKSCLGE